MSSLSYLSEERIYKLKVNFILEKPGDYQIWPTKNETTFKGKDKCDRYRVDTKIKGALGGRTLLEFTVIP